MQTNNYAGGFDIEIYQKNNKTYYKVPNSNNDEHEILFPFTITNDILQMQILTSITVKFTSDITLTSANQYFICGSDYINFTSNADKSIYINATDYPVLHNDGCIQTNQQYSNININLNIVRQSPQQGTIPSELKEGFKYVNFGISNNKYYDENTGDSFSFSSGVSTGYSVGATTESPTYGMVKALANNGTTVAPIVAAVLSTSLVTFRVAPGATPLGVSVGVAAATLAAYAATGVSTNPK